MDQDLNTIEGLQRKLEIEEALERVRSSAMAMKSSDELGDVLSVLFKQFDLLGIRPKTAWLTLWNPEENTFTYRSTGTSGLRIQGQQVLSIDGMDIWRDLYEKWKTDTSDSVEVLFYSKESLGQLFGLLEETYLAMPKEERLTPEHFPEGGYSVQGHCEFGYIGYTHTLEPSEEDKEILTRFATEFGRVYQRFMEIEKAEAQAREAQIEAALERVRARSMAMQNTDELTDVLCVLFEQFDVLGIHPVLTHLTLFDEKNQRFTLRITTDPRNKVTAEQEIDISAVDAWKQSFDTWKHGDAGTVDCIDYPSEVLPAVWEVMHEVMDALPEEYKIRPSDFPHGLYTTQGHCRFGYLGFNHHRRATEEEKGIVARFAAEFGRVYQRFLDLQKLEAQARESQIEAALERVRAKTMAMHNSQDVGNTVITLFQEVMKLGLDNSIRCGIGILEGYEGMETWSANSDKKGKVILKMGMLNMKIHPMLVGLKKAWQKGDKTYSYHFVGVDVTKYYTALNMEPEYPFHVDLSTLPENQFANIFFFTEGILFAFTQTQLTEEAKRVLERFASVFGQTYRRYLDLLKAEAQAREAQIETALERVRARSMAMHRTDELQDVINTVYQQFMELEVAITGGAFIVINSDIESELVCWGAGGTADYIQKVHLPFMDMPIYTELVSKIKEGPGFFKESFTNSEKQAFFKLMFKNPPYNKASAERKKEVLSRPGGYTRSCVVSDHTSIFIINHHGRAFTVEENDILRRMGKVFEQTYVRFLDLQMAEAQAREAQIEAALERVRSRSMAMQQSEELKEVIQVIFDQLALLNINAEHAGIVVDYKAGQDWTFWVAETQDIPSRITIPYQGSLWDRQFAEAKNQGTDFFTTQLDFEEKNAFYRELLPHIPNLDKKAEEFYFACPGLAISTSVQEDIGLYIENFSGTPYSTEENEILNRFGKVCQQTYTRFLDIRKAEDNARESEIQLALERVRARTMAMHQSAELGDVASVLFGQLNALVDNLWTCGFVLCEKDRQEDEWWLGMDGGFTRGFFLPNVGDYTHATLYEGWIKGDDFREVILEGQALEEHYDWLMENPVSRKIFEEMDAAGLEKPEYQKLHAAYFSRGYLCIITQVPSPEDEIFKRFAQVFDLTYTRFLDLKKAEAQAREAQIETALERVRARTMAMHKSQELGEVAAVLFEQIDSLGATLERLNIGIVREEEEIIEWWSTEQGGRQIDHLFKGSIHEPTTISKVYSAWKDGLKKLELDQTGVELQQWIQYVTEVIGLPFDKKLIHDRRVHSAAFFKHGALLVSTPEPLPAGSIDLLERFAGVFEQTYTRFLDLQKAEQQAREAEIEAALERIRAKTMAMHNTDDIADTVITFFEELISLGLDKSMRAGLGILSQSEHMQLWTASVPETSKTILHRGSLDMTTHPLLVGAKRAWDKADPYFTYILEGKDLKDYFRNLNEAPDYPTEFDLDKLPEIVNHRSIPFTDGFLFTFTESPLPEEIIHILERFAAVFGQTYTRYLDLQKAEKRARESRVEAALERVRAQALAMHSSQDLRQTITAIFEELKNLDVKTIRLGLGLLNPDEPEGEIITSRIGDQGEIIEVNGTFRLEGHPVLEGVYAHFKKQEDYFPVLQGEEIITYYGSLQKSVDVQGLGTSSSHYGCFLYFPEGALYAWAARQHSDEQVGILKKFSRVVEITYRRYNDLIESEAREKEAVKQASLDRVRAEISSMRTASDLGRITPLIWNELITLGVPFFRCGVFIVDEKEKKIHSYLSNPKGESLAAWEVRFGQIPVFDEMVKSWQKQEVFLIEWDRQGFLDFSQLLIEHGLVDDRERYQSGKDAPQHLVLHMMPFAQGMLYVGSQSHLEPGQMELVQALADAFSVAYARYEDFKQLEKTLADLKATQAQLIQSEKMASLGELTAGIAHEIKNPLNFVNNFSDVTRELVEEMIEELKKGDVDEADAIAKDVIQNLEKIVHHGSRADSIVKGMLQHSRSSDGQKELTDLNELADEYLRLAYHGLRAKDKSFNANMETDIDQTISKVHVIPQDIGRVLLNLITNAFHAVNERKDNEGKEYDPTVWVQTEKTTGGIAISVRDNGGGIPEKIRDKIFQPFFTTKPTGQGTGLGLSLSYDIVKAHGGTISVESQEGTGTKFVINLPAE